MNCPNSDSSSSPTGFSSETGSLRGALDRVDLLGLDARDLGDLVGGRLAPSSVTSLRSARPILLSFSTTWTGMRIVRALSARRARSPGGSTRSRTVENLKPLR
jgi:hypothetical protein